MSKYPSELVIGTHAPDLSEAIDKHKEIMKDAAPDAVVGVPFGERSPKRNMIYWGQANVRT